MKGFLNKLHGGGQGQKENSLVGKCIQCSNYNLICEEAVGSGGYASIYRVRDQGTNAVLALKHLRLHPDTDAVAEVRQEMKIMHLLGNHPNILKLHAASFAGPAGNETDAFMVMDYCPVTLLGMMQRSNFQLDEFFIHEVFSEVCHAVAHMHLFSPPYAHRDIKAENVLKTAQGKWVLCDFGSATTKAQVFESQAEIAMEEEVIRRTTTPAYRAPEMWDLLSRHRIDTKVDIWALGVLLYVLVFGKLPFQGDSKLSVLFGKYDMPLGKPQAFCDLIKELLTTDPAARPDILTVISRLDGIKQTLYAAINSGVPPPTAGPTPVQQQQPAVALPAGTHHQAGQHKPGQQQHQHHAQQHQQHRPGGPLQVPPAHHGSARPAATVPVPGPHGLGVGVAASHAINTQRAGPVPPQPGPTAVAQRAEAMIQPLHPPPPPGSSFSASQHKQSAPATAAATPASHPPQPAPITRSDHSLTRANQIPLESRRITMPVVTAAVAAAAANTPQSDMAQKAVQLAASTPLFVPTDGALQYGSSPARSLPGGTSQGGGAAAGGGGGGAPGTVSTADEPASATGTLIDIDVGAASQQHLLDAQSPVPFPPQGKVHGHKHKRSSSFGATESFEPDWGDQPAFSDGSRLDSSAAGAGPAGHAQHAAAAHHGQRPRSGSKTESGHVVSYKMSDAPHPPLPSKPHHHGPASQPLHPVYSNSRKSSSRPESPPGGSGGDGRRSGGGGVDPRHDFGSVAFRSEPPGPTSMPAAVGVQHETANGGVAGHSVNSVTSPPPTNGMEVDLLRVQVKGLTASQTALANRVKQLESTVAEQAALIRALQKELFGSRSHSSAGGGSASGAAQAQHKRVSGEGVSNTKSTWHAFEPNSPR